MANSILTQSDIQSLAPELDLSAYSATSISGICSQATNRAVQFCNVAGFDFTQETAEEDRAYISNDGELAISVRRRPIYSVSAITLLKGGFSTSLVLTSNGTDLFQKPYPGNKIVFPNSYFYLTGTYLAGGSSQLYTLRGAKVFYQITYYGGYQVIPDDLKYACLLYARDILAKRSNPTGVQSFTQGSYSETSTSNPEGKSRLILEAEDVLLNGGYVRREF